MTKADYRPWQWRDAFLDLMAAARRMKAASQPTGEPEHHKGYVSCASNLVSRGQHFMKTGKVENDQK